MEQDAWKQQFFSDRMPACLLNTDWLTFAWLTRPEAEKVMVDWLTPLTIVRVSNTKVD